MTDSFELIRNSLEYLNVQMISVMTDTVNARLRIKENYDPRGLISGAW
jgi:hypothetical protein